MNLKDRHWPKCVIDLFNDLPEPPPYAISKDELTRLKSVLVKSQQKADKWADEARKTQAVIVTMCPHENKTINVEYINEMKVYLLLILIIQM
jgi:hypothetical protein